ncbi:MAG: protein phosphatase CheZ [Thiobacillaceae bacterium]|jgi:chemotaxis protein CheZ|nr:protein phosphatase CheZ [Thiobacillaceae bacterium]
MSDLDTLRRDLSAMVEQMRATMDEIGERDMPQTSVVSNARDRLRYISALTEQSAAQTLHAAEAISDRLRAQQAAAAALVAKTRSPDVRAFLAALQAEHRQSIAEASEIIQAQAFQDLVGQVVNKLMVMVQGMEDSLAHLLLDEEDERGRLSGPAVREADRVSQADVDDLFD